MADGFVTIDVNNNLPAVVMAELDTTYAKVRVDTTVGKRVFVTDAAGVEHLVSADTGWRDITGLVVNGWTAQYILARRFGALLDVRINSLVDTAATSTEFISSLPPGFRFDAARTTYIAASLMTGTAGSQSGIVNVAGASGEKLRATRPQSNGNGGISGSTIGPWPTVLPGTPG